MVLSDYCVFEFELTFLYIFWARLRRALAQKYDTNSCLSTTKYSPQKPLYKLQLHVTCLVGCFLENGMRDVF